MGDLNSRQATLHDVARLAQVSHQTVSRVINHSPNVAEATRERVEQAIAQLNYRPNRAARCLITGKSLTLQIIEFEPTFVTPVPLIVSAAYERGYRSGISILREHSLDALYLLLDELSSWMVDGIILLGPQISLDAETIQRKCRGIACVQMGGEMTAGIAGVALDQVGGIRAALDALYHQGHRNIAALTGRLTTYDGRVRHEAYLAWLEEKGLKAGPIVEGNFTPQRAYDLGLDLVRQGGFTAVLCGNDTTAVGLASAARDLGKQIPRDFSLVGFDDHSLSRFFCPPLTTVAQDFGVLSQATVSHLINLISGQNGVEEHLLLQPELITRKSIAPPPAV